MRDDYCIVQEVWKLGDKIDEPRRPSDVLISDPVHERRTYWTPRVDQSVQLPFDPAVYVDPDERELDETIGRWTQARGLDIDDA